MYMYYIIISIMAIMSPINAYNRKEILNGIDVENEVVIVSVGILIIYMSILLMRGKNIIPVGMSLETIKYLIINILLGCVGLYLGGYMIKRYDVMRFKAMRQPIYLLFLVIIGCLVYKRKCNSGVIVGIGLLICGCVLVDRNLRG